MIKIDLEREKLQLLKQQIVYTEVLKLIETHGCIFENTVLMSAKQYNISINKAEITDIIRKLFNI
jgi:hypothetical protein